MKILEKMLEVETEARQIVEDAKTKANEIRKKAREDAKLLIVNGKKDVQRQIQDEITHIETQAEKQKAVIMQEMQDQLERMEQQARERIEPAVELVLTDLLT